MTRLAVTTGLDAWDIPALRFGVAGVLLFPVVVRRGLALDRLGWLGLCGLVAGTGAPYALVVAFGLHLAPAYDAGALNPGCMPLFVALIGTAILREKPSAAQTIGLALILSGALIVIAWRGATWSMSRSFGDALFLAASLLTACYTVILRRSKLDPLHAAALVSSVSLLIYAPFYVAIRGLALARLPPAGLIVQIIFQRIVVTIVSLVLYGRAVLILGAANGSAFGALVPALSAVLAIPLLREWPAPSGWVGIALISAGVYLASGAPLPKPPAPRKRARQRPCQPGESITRTRRCHR